MKKYYIIRPDGSSIFALPYPEDFCIHCLFLLQNDGHRYKLLSSDFAVHAQGVSAGGGMSSSKYTYVYT